MADVICPNCGKPNPEHLEECQFCQARLAGAGRPEPDWLQSLRGDEDAGAFQGEDEIPAWLADLGEDDAGDSEVDDFLDHLMDETSGGADQSEPVAGSAETPDAGASERPPREHEPTSISASGFDEDLVVPEWVVEFKTPSPPAASGPPEVEPAPPAGETPAEAGPGLPAEPAQELPAWLSELGEPPIRETGRQEPEIPGSAAGGDQAGQDVGWLAGFVEDESEGGEIPAAEQDVPGAGDEDEETGWFEAVPEGQQPEAVPENKPPGEAEELPSWLADLPDETPAASAVSEAESTPEADLPGEPVGEEAAAASSQIPDWLVDALDQAQAEAGAGMEEGVKSPEEAPAGDDLEDWLANFEAEIESEPETGPDEEVPSWLADATSGSRAESEAELSAELPDWLKSAEAGSMAETGAKPEPAAAADDIPAWLQELNEKTSAMEQPPGEEPQAGEQPAEKTISEEERAGETEAMDWLPGRSEGAALGMLSESGAFEEDLAPGELPDWLKAMRPTDVSKPGTMETGEIDSGPIEQAGPLAGLRGVLSAQPSATVAGSPPAHAVRLQVSGEQQKKADQLQKMVVSETDPRPAHRRLVLSEQRVLRYIIAAVLFMAALLPFALPGSLSNPPPLPSGMESLGSLLSGLSADAHVLLVADYQPGLSGELDAAAGVLLDRIMAQGARMALLSTSPTGPALAERLVRMVAAERGYEYGTHYVNLGYIPGEATGLQAFASAPKLSVLLGYDDSPLWSLLDRSRNDPWRWPALQGVNDLADFRMTVLISDDPEAVRRWIEQVEPGMGDTPLVVVSSAQAEPLLRPYKSTGSGQITVLVPGLQGGAAFEGFTQQEGRATAIWDGYGVGILSGIILVLGAGTYNLLLAWNQQEAERKARR